ncbi:DUF1761 domain-containing protein [Lysobacter korlensis]|uniref:DUF1761 domain-containing protein n=1 Tax=Lysobacter korlensis TaxID=553636 RepID=A0ABV6RXF9_9GAMM
MVPEINIWAVLLATLSSMLVGALWYSKPLFGRRWVELARVDESRMQSSAVGAYIVTIFASFLTAAVLAGSVAIAQEFYGGSFFLNSLVTAVILWIGFTAARFLTHDAFERRPAALTTMNLGYELVTILVMAAIIGAFGS